MSDIVGSLEKKDQIFFHRDDSLYFKKKLVLWTSKVLEK